MHQQNLHRKYQTEAISFSQVLNIHLNSKKVQHTQTKRETPTLKLMECSVNSKHRKRG